MIDSVLQEGGNTVNGKFRIYEQFNKSLSSRENAEFLKNEYGIGGRSADYNGISEDHSAKGIVLSAGRGENEQILRLTWLQVEKRIRELINIDRYLSEIEKDEYYDWLDANDRPQINNEVEKQIKDEEYELAKKLHSFIKDYDFYSYIDNIPMGNTDEENIELIRADINDELNIKDYIDFLKATMEDIDYDEEEAVVARELLVELEKRLPYYEFNIGDIVYIGTQQYEIRTIDDNRVILVDTSFPLLTKEMERKEFDRKVKENPANDKLRNEKIIQKLKTNEEKYTKQTENKQEDTTQINTTEPKPETKQENKLKANIKTKRRNKIEYFDLHPEIPLKDRNNYKITDNSLGEGTKKEKYKRNIEAIKVLQQCEQENRYATPEEQEILSQYVGWGGIPEAFDKSNDDWTKEYNEFSSLLTEKEYKEAKQSTLTSFYTPPIVINSIYKALAKMGLSQGNILEPSCGTGNFMGMLPDNLKQCKMYGIEIDGISGRIARQLYQKNTIAVKGFEEIDLPDSFFDVAVGNVPFGDYKLYDKRYDKNKFQVHDYFFAKALDKVRPNGVIAFITSRGTMDKENEDIRKYICQRAELIGAIRLPNNTFKKNAGTEVTSDIIFLKKRDKITDIEDDWVELAESEDGIRMNKYFVDHPEMILGKMEMTSGRFGLTPTCTPYEIPLENLLDQAIININSEIEDYQIDLEDEEEKSIPADPSVRNFSYTIVDNQIYYRENSRMYLQDIPVTATSRIKGMIAIRDCVRNLIELQTDNASEDEIKQEQIKLNSLYDSFTRTYGIINSRGNENAFSDDSSYYLLCSLEIIDENKKFIKKADMFTKRTIKPHKAVTEVSNSIDALILSISEKARVDIEYMTNLTGKTEQELVKELEGSIYKDPMKEIYVTADEYLSGNVREKLKIAEEFAKNNPEYEKNVDSLKKVKPQDLSASEISVRLGATWLPTEIIEQFIFELLKPNSSNRDRISVHYSDYTSEWNIVGKSEDKGNILAYSTYGTTRANAYRIIETTLNLKDVRITDTVIDEKGNEQKVLNAKETAIAQAKQEKIKEEFLEWIWKDQSRREKLVKIYNEKFNSIKPREYDGQYIQFSGINPEITLRKHQIDAIAHILYGGNTLLAHEVGAGKTFEMVASAMESKRLGLCSKSLFVVPNHIIEQFASEFLQLYPSANVLVATKKDFATNNRKKFCSKIATGEYDAIIIGHSQFEKIPMSKERQEKILQNQIFDLSCGIDDLKINDGEYYSIKQLEKTKKKIEEKLKRLNDQSRKDDIVTFEQLGCDRIFIDEAHYFKNLFLFTKMRNVGGIAQTEAQKSSDLFMKCQYLDELTEGRGIVFATGTPISNSMVEMYTMQRYLQYNTLEKANLLQFDSWASTFGETVSAIELNVMKMFDRKNKAEYQKVA
ncbi:MAG: DEAD/DEAH box helicase family protein [Clostridia bacterium]|nr:DEAD/DEAH box helicase family protein [Clostridia bacterium]